MTDKIISDILNASELLQRTIDPEGILANGKIIRITHKLSEDRMGFSWKAETAFPNDDVLKMHGKYHTSIGFFINRCIYAMGNTKTEVPLNPSETLFLALKNVTGLPVRMKANLVRIDPKKSVLGLFEDAYGIQNFFSAMDVLFFGIEGGEADDVERQQFNELTMIMRKDINGLFSKNNIIGTYTSGSSTIRARATIDMYGLGSQTVTLEKSFSGKDEISAYCYTEDFTGKKVPSLKLAFRLDKMLAGKEDVHQHVERNSMEMPSSETTTEERKPEKAWRPKNKPKKKHPETSKHETVIDPYLVFSRPNKMKK